MTIPLNDDRLPCGTQVADLLDQVADGRGADRDPHQQQCPHCQAALAEYDRLWSPVRELATEHVEAPDSILEAALEQIRQAVEHADYGLVSSADGLTSISARVVVVIARESAQGVSGVRVALSRHLTEVSAGVAGATAAVQITLAADHGIDLPDLGDRVRRTVADRIRTLTGLEPATVTIVIDDVLPPR